MARRHGIEPAQALADSQRWWRDLASPSLAAAADLPHRVIELWCDVLGSAPDEWALRAAHGHLQRRDQHRLREDLTSPLAHAAYRFCCGFHFRDDEADTAHHVSGGTT